MSYSKIQLKDSSHRHHIIRDTLAIVDTFRDWSCNENVAELNVYNTVTIGGDYYIAVTINYDTQKVEFRKIDDSVKGKIYGDKVIAVINLDLTGDDGDLDDQIINWIEFRVLLASDVKLKKDFARLQDKLEVAELYHQELEVQIQELQDDYNELEIATIRVYENNGRLEDILDKEVIEFE